MTLKKETMDTNHHQFAPALAAAAQNEQNNANGSTNTSHHTTNSSSSEGGGGDLLAALVAGGVDPGLARESLLANFSSDTSGRHNHHNHNQGFTPLDSLGFLLGHHPGGGASSQLANLQALRLRALLGGSSIGGAASFLAPPPPPPRHQLSLAQQLAEIEALRRRAGLMQPTHLSMGSHSMTPSSLLTLTSTGNANASGTSPLNLQHHINIFDRAWQMDQARSFCQLPEGASPHLDPSSSSSPTTASGAAAAAATGNLARAIAAARNDPPATTSLHSQARTLLEAETTPRAPASLKADDSEGQGGPLPGRPDEDTDDSLAGADMDPPPNRILQLPPVEEGETPHYSRRVIVPLGIEEDANFLSERQVYIRSQLLEVVRASHEEVLVRSSSKSISYQQVGIRCRYCAHLQPGSRAIRASAFPSSIPQMYQSFTMMVRDHFGACAGIPSAKKERFLNLKGLTSPSSSLSRQYWTYAAKKLGMRDSEFGIMITEDTQRMAQQMPPFGTTLQESESIKSAPVEFLVEEGDVHCISPYLHFLMTHTQVIHLLPSERVGKRKDAAVGLPGFGCRHCVNAGRLGFCRIFPLNKRSLPDKVNDLYNHIVRCPQCPTSTKRLLESRRSETEGNRKHAERDREFIDRIWYKLGRDSDEAFKKSS